MRIVEEVRTGIWALKEMAGLEKKLTASETAVVKELTAVQKQIVAKLKTALVLMTFSPFSVVSITD